MSRWSKYDVCPTCRAPASTRCRVTVRGPGPGYGRRITEMPASRPHRERPVLPSAVAR
jgi:hypothetical protein